MSRKVRVARSFEYAFSGLISAFKNEPNFRIHLIMASFALFFGFSFKIDYIEWIVLVFSIFMVLIFELFNTSIEALVDLASPAIHPKAKIAKDVSAAAVMLSSICAGAVGLIIFGPRFIELLLM